MKDKRLLSPKEAALVLHVSIKTITRWDAAGKLRTVRTEGKHTPRSIAEIHRLQRHTQSEDSCVRCKHLPAPIIRYTGPEDNVDLLVKLIAAGNKTLERNIKAEINAAEERVKMELRAESKAAEERLIKTNGQR